VQEVFGDFKAINEDFFSLDVPTVSLGMHDPKEWTNQDASVANRMVDGLFGVVMATRSSPQVRFEGNSKLCRYIAENLQAKLDLESEFVQRTSRNSEQTMLLILDRKEDPVTPLLNQWTYQAMVHELLTIHNNRVDLKHLETLDQDMREVVLSSDDDRFFRKVMYSNFGDLAQEIEQLVRTFV
jgi:vacuolar protein sorting-associated protein 45